jgi:hypothetical protein
MRALTATFDDGWKVRVTQDLSLEAVGNAVQQ